MTEMMKERSEVWKVQVDINVNEQMIDSLGHNRSRMEVPMDRVSRSPQEAQNPKKRSHSSRNDGPKLFYAILKASE